MSKNGHTYAIHPIHSLSYIFDNTIYNTPEYFKPLNLNRTLIFLCMFSRPVGIITYEFKESEIHGTKCDRKVNCKPFGKRRNGTWKGNRFENRPGTFTGRNWHNGNA